MFLRFHLYFSDRKYEYDIYNLLKAFYPSAELELRYLQDPEQPEQSACTGQACDLPDEMRENADAVFLVQYGPHSAAFSYACSEELTAEQCREKQIDADKNPGYQERIAYILNIFLSDEHIIDKTK